LNRSLTQTRDGIIPKVSFQFRNTSDHFVVKLGIEMDVCEITEWNAGSSSEVLLKPDIIFARITFTGVDITDPNVLLNSNYSSCNLLVWAIDDEGELCMQAGFPVGPDFPVDLARRQLQVCMGYINE
jgi:hypothetical protein